MLWKKATALSNILEAFYVRKPVDARRRFSEARRRLLPSREKRKPQQLPIE